MHNISPRKLLRNLIILAIVSCNIGCDQISKTVVRNSMHYYENITLLNNHITLTKVENSGAFLSLGNDLPFFTKFMILWLLPLIVLLSALYLVVSRTNMPRRLVLGLCFVIGGGLGNLYDRIMYGSVTDFLHIDFIVFRTGIFNLADVSIMIGMCLIIWNIYKAKLIPTHAK